MKRILLALFFGYLFGAVVFGQEPVAVELQPLVNLDGFFEGITEWFTDNLKKCLVIFLSVFFVWVSYYYSMKMLDHRTEEHEGRGESQVQIKSETVEDTQVSDKSNLKDCTETEDTEKREIERLRIGELLRQNENQSRHDVLDFEECCDRKAFCRGY